MDQERKPKIEMPYVFVINCRWIDSESDYAWCDENDSRRTPKDAPLPETQLP